MSKTGATAGPPLALLMPSMRKTKILGTLGPATESPQVISNLIAKGADVIRLNMSHASHDWVRVKQLGLPRLHPRIERHVKGANTLVRSIFDQVHN